MSASEAPLTSAGRAGDINYFHIFSPGSVFSVISFRMV